MGVSFVNRRVVSFPAFPGLSVSCYRGSYLHSRNRLLNMRERVFACFGSLQSDFVGRPIGYVS